MAFLKDALRRVEVQSSKDGAPGSGSLNDDTRPLPPHRRTYGPWQFVTLWVITGSFNIGGWTTGSSILALGLSVWQCMLTVIIGNVIVGVLCVLSGAPGAKWHIGFPIIQRASWGVRGSVFVVLQRFFLACIWFSTQVYWGGQCLRTFLTALAPSFRNLDKSLAGGTLTTGDFTAFIIFTILYLPLIWIAPEKYKVPFLISCACIIPTIFALLVWFTASAKGGGDLLHDVSSLAGVRQAEGSHLAWMLILGICTNISSISVHIFVQSDYTRFARRPKDQILAQLVMVPLGTIVTALIGIICTSCAAKLFPEQAGTLLWEPYRLLDALQLHYHDSSGARAAVAFSSFAFMVAQFGMVVANNGLSGGMDIASLLPRYFTIRRGMLFLAAVSFITQPWQLLNNGANKFLVVLGGYGVFIGPMTGVMFSDYFLVRRRVLKLSDLYTIEPSSIYYYRNGLNWRAFVAWTSGVWITLPGFVRQVQGGEALPGWSNMYYMSWPLGTLISLLTYYILYKVAPIKGVGISDDVDYFGVEGGAGALVINGKEDGSWKPSGEKHECSPSLTDKV
ncbi:putative uracil permease [Eremomyces bilateralis CBS 781.70]|uniref:Uracil permease n=1 Tax=Eremomyces bilateralis CBS 781.70 TaxID=1392243 RepID=A0A6G1G1I2_9PEZI|nr:putative uracil permease [Eremomyces bilateralis CBS 781.70]KAF1811842.1 putative uracil permease [Eremomyces bilateralis CBS 781.70]